MNAVEKPKIKIGINGFGGIGRLVARAVLQRDDMEVVAINDPCFENEHVNNLKSYGLNHGPWPFHGLLCRGTRTNLFNERGKFVKKFVYRNRALIPWADTGAEYVVETSSEVIGKKNDNDLTDIDNAYVHIKDGGAKKVIIAAYSDDAPIFVVGVNEHEYKSTLDVVAAGSRTTNCLAPLVKVIHDRFGIIEGQITAYHSLNGDQETIDGIKAVMRMIPDLNEKLMGGPCVIPTLDVSMTEFILMLEKDVNLNQIEAAIKEESEGKMQGILGCIECDVASREFIGDNRSCFFDPNASFPLGESVVKLSAFYNNEWGYSSSVVKLIAHMAQTC